MGRDAGVRDVLVTIQAKTDSTDSSGFPIEAWTDLASLFAAKRVLTTAESFRAGRESAMTMCAFLVPYRADIDPDRVDLPAQRRVVDRGRIYDIVGAEAEGRKDHVRLICQTGQQTTGGTVTAARAGAAGRVA